MGFFNSIGSALSSYGKDYLRGPSQYGQQPDQQQQSLYAPSARPPRKLYGDLNIQYGAPNAGY